ncbi:ABC transporter substrate-binding protein [Acinetobacter defluvii]|uniref:ABC transporter substrate-binding protein n=1 Tax=Acinetobacter defluvii TaxID=1871111 RepID=A0A2S2FFH2_9GAMM|nr:ABC transporter substrate-binding protein [Acinetobacter defluvii]AWL29658.1 ABC transporter substrate-binding protein [Acinetobacter defluvii]
MRFHQKLIAISLTAALAACSAQNSSSESKQNTQTSEQSTNTVTYQSKAGEITIPQHLSRITVLDTNALNTIQTLGASDQVVALPQGTPLPAAIKSFANAEKYQDTGTATEPNLEKIAASQPELIILSNRMEKHTDQMKAIAPTYNAQVDYADRLNSFKQQTLNIATMVGKKAEAEQQLQALERDMQALREKTKGKTALVILVNNNKLSAYGVGSRFGLIHDLYGFSPADDNIKVGTHGMSVSHEFIAQTNPDYLFVIDRGAAISEKSGGAQKVLDNAIVKQTKAAQNNKIIYLDSSTWYLMNDSLGGMQSMLKEVQNAV